MQAGEDRRRAIVVCESVCASGQCSEIAFEFAYNRVNGEVTAAEDLQYRILILGRDDRPTIRILLIERHRRRAAENGGQTVGRCGRSHALTVLVIVVGNR